MTYCPLLSQRDCDLINLLVDIAKDPYMERAMLDLMVQWHRES